MLWSAAVFTAALLLTGTAIANPGSEPSKAERELAEAEATLEGATEDAREAGRELAEAENRLPGARDRVDEARGAVAAAEVLAEEAARDAEDARQEHHEAEGDFDTAQSGVEESRDDLGDMAAQIYQRDGLVAFNEALKSKDLFDAVDRMSFANEFVRRQNNAVEEVVKARQDARVAENEAEQARDDAEAAEAAAAEALDEAEAEAERAEDAEAELDGLIDTKSEALRVAKREKDASLDQYEEAKAASERVADKLRDTGSGDSSPPSSSSGGGGGGFLMPVNGWKSSDFGNRYDPYYKVWQLHAGTDFAAPGGAPIYAVDSGSVVQAGWNGGYGNYTCVYHGDNVSTCYGHQSSIGVSPGQHVSRGQRIGSVGTTGASTGNHLHFEVRVNGSPVQPLGWLPSCLC